MGRGLIKAARVMGLFSAGAGMVLFSAMGVSAQMMLNIDSDDTMATPVPTVSTLPRLKPQQPVPTLSQNMTADVFGLPPFALPEKTMVAEDSQPAQPNQPQAPSSTEMGKIINQLAVQGVFPGREVLINAYVVPVGSTFAVKVKDDETVYFHIQQATSSYVLFGWSKSNALYRYSLPSADGKQYETQIAPVSQKGMASL